MKWEIILEGHGDSNPLFVEVNDGTTPPVPGDRFDASGDLAGHFIVIDRKFLIETTTKNGECACSWSFILKRKER